MDFGKEFKKFATKDQGDEGENNIILSGLASNKEGLSGVASCLFE